MSHVIAGTGHRPEKLGGYSPAARGQLLRVARSAVIFTEPTKVISGMALGWDTALALAAIVERVPLVAYVPFAGQELRWPLESQRTFHWILERCAAVEVVCPGEYSARKMQIRNIAMVDDCDEVAAMWDGSPGGTGNCVAYAEGKKPIRNFYQWLTAPSP